MDPAVLVVDDNDIEGDKRKAGRDRLDEVLLQEIRDILAAKRS